MASDLEGLRQAEEAVARALYNTQRSPVLERHAWERADPALQEDYRALARAALGAEPVARLYGELGRCIEAMESMIGYVPEFFVEKWGYDDEIASAREFYEGLAALEPFAGITEGDTGE